MIKQVLLLISFLASIPIFSIQMFSIPIALISMSAAANTEWPQWLGNDLQEEHQTLWEMDATEESVTFSPRGENPTVWVLVSRKASSYDTALSTILNEFRLEMPSVSFQVFLLPKTTHELIAWTKKADKNANLIYTLGSRATSALYNSYKGGKLPVVSANAKDPVLLGLADSYQSSGNNFAFTSLNLPPEITLSFLQRFKPELRQIGVLYAKSNKGAYLTQYLPLKQVAIEQGIDIFPIEIDEKNPSQLLSKVMHKQVGAMEIKDSQLKHSMLWLTGSSSLLNRLGEINQYSKTLPLLTAVPNAVNGSEKSALMSVGVGFENNAHQAALYGLKILSEHVAPSSLPVGVLSPPDISISFKQSKRVDTKVPFVLIEMASDIYADNGNVVRSAGVSMEINR